MKAKYNLNIHLQKISTSLPEFQGLMPEIIFEFFEDSENTT